MSVAASASQTPYKARPARAVFPRARDDAVALERPWRQPASGRPSGSPFPLPTRLADGLGARKSPWPRLRVAVRPVRRVLKSRTRRKFGSPVLVAQEGAAA